MNDETQNDQQQPQPDGAQNTATQQTTAIPYDRFKEVNDRMKAAETELKKLRDAEIKRQESEALARGEHQRIIDDLRPKAQKADELEAAVNEILTAELDSLPEHLRDLVPEGSAAAKLKWIKAARAKGLFTTPKAPQLDAGAVGDPKQTIKLTIEQQQAARMAKMTNEQYIAALLKSQGE